MSDNKNLHNSKINRNDEYYTLTADIEKYLPYFSHLFENKVVYCNCDNYNTSNFFKFLRLNFIPYRIKRLVATCYNGDSRSFGFIKTSRGERSFDLQGNGDFRSEESLSILRHSDIVVTNPPFTLFREFIGQLLGHSKDFVVIGHLTSAGYKIPFQNFQKGRLFAIDNYSQDFDTPEGENSPVNCMWYTSFYVNHPMLRLTEWYHKDRYPKFVNYDAIYVDKIREIPKDYYGVMGVPLTFLSQHNQEQFEILGITRGYSNSTNGAIRRGQYREIDRKGRFTGRVTTENDSSPYLPGKSKKGNNYVDEHGNFIHGVFARILIRRRK